MFFQERKELFIGLPPLLVTEQDLGRRVRQIIQGLHEQGKRGFKVNAVCSEYDIWSGYVARWKTGTPTYQLKVEVTGM